MPERDWWSGELAVDDRLNSVVEVAEPVAALSPVAVLATNHRVRQGLQVRARRRSGGAARELGVDPGLDRLIQVSQAGLTVLAVAVVASDDRIR